MSVLPCHLRYTNTHEWVYIGEDGYALVGITDFCQQGLGEMMSVTFPEEGIQVQQGDEVMALEAVKAAVDIAVPVSGEIVGLNEALIAMPTLVNEEPYDAGWLFKMIIDEPDELAELMDDEAYQAWLDQ